MHGADRDIMWLERDFGIYVCNMFDTGQVLTLIKVFWEKIELLSFLSRHLVCTRAHCFLFIGLEGIENGKIQPGTPVESFLWS